ncbi:glycoside hydrolase superfamily [Aspergillus terricola var. indicus]
MRLSTPYLPLLYRWTTARFVQAQQGATCSELEPCLEGCCSKFGSCGFGDDFCGDDCVNNCDVKAQCGENENLTSCPFGVWCSEFGFCGDGCQSGCDVVVSPSCTSTGDSSSLERVIAYYELFQFSRPCDTMQPESIPAGALTHINLAFYGDIVSRVSRLKTTYAGLRVNVVIGGWNFNDPPTSTYFSTMAGSYEHRQTFIKSLVSYLQNMAWTVSKLVYWEYPSATNCGGSPDDTDNFVTLLSEMRDDFHTVNPGWEITCTLPSSYWYMQNFNLKSMQKYISFFNMMSYDLHGMWDQGNKFTGSYLRGHTNLTEIDQAFDLLWRNDIDTKNVVMGMGFYGRSFTMSDKDCWTADCEFSIVGGAGTCSQTAGILYYSEIKSTNSSSDVRTYYDPVSTVKYNVYNGNRWISYDDAQSWQDNMRYLTGKCISGVMIWALDQDDGCTVLLPLFSATRPCPAY